AESSGGSIAKDPSEYQDEIIQGMNELGIEVTEDKVQCMIRQIATESGGDPNVVQGGPGSSVDINTFAPVADGWTCPWCPSSTGASCENYNRAHGLMQMIPTTFISNAQPGHDNVFNSYDSILAALNYINRHYGGDFTQIGNGTGY
ncbi:transglycosylase SLT domain-containing protein, partial [Eubacterium aggregans]